MAEKNKRIELRVSEDFYKRVDLWRRKWGWTMTVAVSYMLSEQMNFLENHRYKNAGVQPQNPYPDTKNETVDEFNQDVPQSALLKSMGFKIKK